MCKKKRLRGISLGKRKPYRHAGNMLHECATLAATHGAKYPAKNLSGNGEQYRLLL